MKGQSDAMPLARFLRRTAAVALDPALLLFAALVAFVLDFGLGAAQTLLWLVPGVIATVFATSALTKYATIVTRAVALGLPVPAADNAVFDYLREPWAFVPWLGLAAVGGVAWAAQQTFGPVAAMAVLALALPLLPAAVAVLCLDRSFVAMLRLREVARFVRILGVDYLKILAGWAVIVGAGHLLPVGGYMAFGVVLPVGSYPSALLLCLQVLWVFSSTGVVLYHHHAALGIPVARLPREERQQRQVDAGVLRERQRAIDEAYGYFSRGNAPGGLQRLRDYLVAHDDTDAWSWFLDRTRGWESPQAFLLIAQNYLPRLLANGDDGGALALLIQCMQKDPDFAPRPEERARLRTLLEGHAFAERAARWS